LVDHPRVKCEHFSGSLIGHKRDVIGDRSRGIHHTNRPITPVSGNPANFAVSPPAFQPQQTSKMSWQSYVDDQLLATKAVSNAVICGHDGNIWAKSGDFAVTTEELKALSGRFDDVGMLAQSGITVAGIRYMYLSSRDGPVKVVRAKKDRNGVHCIKTNQTFIICTYQEPTVPEQAALVTEKLGDYLVGVGY